MNKQKIKDILGYVGGHRGIMEKHHIFDEKYLHPRLRGIDPLYHKYIVCLHNRLSEYSFLYKYNEFLFGDFRLIVDSMAGLGIMNSQLNFSIGFTNPKTGLSLEFIIKFELESDEKVAGKPCGFDINIRKDGSSTANGNISIMDYIMHHHLSTEDNPTKYEQNRSFEYNLTNYLNSASNILEGPMKNIVSGKNWDPIPIDWQGYK